MGSIGSVGSVDASAGDTSADGSVSSVTPSVGSTVATPPGTPQPGAAAAAPGLRDESNWQLGRAAKWMLSVHDADDISARSDEQYDDHYDEQYDGRAADEASTTTASAEVC